MEKSAKFLTVIGLSLGLIGGASVGNVKASAGRILSSSPKSIRGSWTGKVPVDGKTKFVIKSHSLTATTSDGVTYYSSKVSKYHVKRSHGIYKCWFPFQVGITGHYYHIGAPIETSDDVQFVKPTTRHHKKALKVYDKPLATTIKDYYYMYKTK